MIDLSLESTAATVVAKIAEDAALSLYAYIKASIIDFSKKNQIAIGTAYKNYLSKSYEQYSMAKTILYGHERKDLYTFYESIGLLHRGKIIDSSDVGNILKVGKRILIVGSLGSGKSILMKHLFLNTIKKAQKIPVLIELRSLNDFSTDEINLKTSIYNAVRIFGFELDETLFDFSLRRGGYVFLFDGFDEIKNSLAPKITKEIFNFCAEFSNNYCIVSSRQSQEFVGWQSFEELQCQKLSKQQALSLIEKLEYDPDIKKRFYEELKSKLYRKYESFASNPLLLTIMLMTFENRSSIPDKKNDFFDQAFSCLFHRHDATKNGYKRETKSKLAYEIFRKVFSYFCFKTFFHSQIEFTDSQVVGYFEEAKTKFNLPANLTSQDFLYDLTHAVCVLINEGLSYTFSHRSFQEYFAAVFTMQLCDDKQKQLFEAWFKQSNFRWTSDFIELLEELQPERFIRNVLMPGLTDLDKLFVKLSSSYDNLFFYLYSRIQLFETPGGSELIIFSNSKNRDSRYLLEIIHITNKISHYDFSQDISGRTDSINYLKTKFGTSDMQLDTKLIQDEKTEFCQKMEWLILRIKAAHRFFSIQKNDNLKPNHDFLSIIDNI